jgi:hypothetical protein
MTTKKQAIAIEREIIRLTAIKNHQNVEEAQKEYTKKLQREKRGQKLKESREMLKLMKERNAKSRKRLES